MSQTARKLITEWHGSKDFRTIEIGYYHSGTRILFFEAMIGRMCLSPGVLFVAVDSSNNIIRTIKGDPYRYE